jgi:serine/threonine protein phosphatase 1
MIILTDIHGNFDTMMALLDMIPQEEKDKGIVICGDLIDRGPKSMQIVDWCIENKIQVVKGNHEAFMIDEVDLVINFIKRAGLIPRGNAGSLWTVHGGYETLESYETYDDEAVDDRGVPIRLFDFEKLKKHAEWMEKLPLFLEFPNLKNEDGRYLVLSHSNIGNVWKMRDCPKEIEFDVLWGRPRKIDDVPEIYNVIGHTPQDYGPRIRKTYANIDTGCYYTKDNTNGMLTALQFPEMVIYEHENIDSKVGHVPRKGVRTVKEIKHRKKLRKVK